jgi:hypothetical protein
VKDDGVVVVSRSWPPSGGVERPRRAVRFARLIHQPVRVLGVPSVRAAFGGNLSLPWWLLRVVPYPTRLRIATCGPQPPSRAPPFASAARAALSSRSKAAGLAAGSFANSWTSLAFDNTQSSLLVTTPP